MTNYERASLYLSLGLASIAISLCNPSLGWLDAVTSVIGIGYLAVSAKYVLRYIFSDEE